MPTGLENELMNDSTVGDLPFEEEVVTYNGNRDYDPGPNTGSYGFVEVEIDGQVLECTNAYTSNAYGGKYCVGDTYTDPNGGSSPIAGIGVHGIQMGQSLWDAEETYAGAGEKMGMTLQEWTDFSAEIQALNETVAGLKGNMFGPTEMEQGRLFGRVQNMNPEWDESQVQAEVDRLLEEQWMTSDAYREAALAETALFQQYGITKPNPAVYGSGVFVDSDGKYHMFESSTGNFYQTSQDTSFLDVAVPIGIAIGAGIISGGAASAITSGLTAGLSSTAAGAINGVLGSAISQGITTGSIDPSSLLQATILGGIGGLADGLVNGDWAQTDLDEAIWSMSDTLGMDYDEVVGLLEGVASGAVSGDDLSDIALGVVGSLGQNEIMNWLEESYGDTINVDDWFKDGQSNIPVDALEPIIGGVINAAIEGGMSNEDALRMAWDYFQAGGDVDFMLPGSPDIDLGNSDFLDWLDVTLPDIDFDLPDINLPEIDLPEIDLPEIDLPEIDLPDCEALLGETAFWNEVTQQCELPDVELPDVELPDVEIPDCEALLGNTAFWNEVTQQCELPDVELPDVELPDVEVEEPEVPDLVECMEGWEWSDLYGECVEKIEDDVTIEEPEIEIPDIEPPELPPAPEVAAQQGNFTPKWTGLFETGTVDVYKAPPLRSLFKDYL